MLEKDPIAIYTQWLEEHSSAVLKVARAYTLTYDDCQDLAQEILLQAWRSLPKFQSKSSPATWFYRVALQTAMNWHRNNRPRRLRERPLLDVQIVTEQFASSIEQLEQRELIDRLYQAIHRLPKTDVALVLLYLDNLSYREIANVVGMSESNVGVRLNRAKKLLATLIDAKSIEGTTDES